MAEDTLYFGSIKPKGWLKKRLEDNLKGFIGELDNILPDLLKNHDIYGKDRLTKKSGQFELGRNDPEIEDGQGNDWQFYWWNSETQSNWKDGFYRSALLLGEEPYLMRTREFVEKLLNTQDKEGYLGIYQEDLRFKHTTENGELWAQSTLLRGLMGYYEAVGEERVLTSILKAVENIMEGYPMKKSHPFHVEDAFSGVGHGLTITDTFWRLYQLLREEKYLDYAVWLYEEYSDSVQAEEDLQLHNIGNKNYKLKGHGVHTYEHIRALAIASIRREEYVPILEKCLSKLEKYITISGAPVGDEWIYGREADSFETGYEFCSLQELLHTYSMLLEMSKDMHWADKIEWMFYNAAQGMIHPKKSAIMYLKTDDCVTADEMKNHQDTRKNPRYKYSSTHQDAAVCCVPNAGRITPYFIQSMYVKHKDGVKIALYGASECRDKIAGEEIRITQKTNYPVDWNVEIEIEVSAPTSFALSMRFPEWAEKMIVDEREYHKSEVENQEVVIQKRWKEKVKITVEFHSSIQIKKDSKNRQFITHGPILYVHEILSEEITYKLFNDKNCGEWGYRPVKEAEQILHGKILEVKHNTIEKPENLENLELWAYVQGEEEKQNILLRPMAGTILRQAAFPL